MRILRILNRLRRKKKYKVFKSVVNRRGLYSISGVSDIECRYRKDEVTTPPLHMEKEGYFLFAFKTLQDAKSYSIGSEVWVAETDKPPIKNLPKFLSPDALRSKRFTTTLEETFPKGTVMCKNLTLLYKVWDLRKNKPIPSISPIITPPDFSGSKHKLYSSI